jgi:hypothetical protein
MYKIPVYRKSTIKSVLRTEGETIEQKVDRIVNNKEPITDGAPEIFTPKKDGVIPAYNPRTDRWEIACETMDSLNRPKVAKSEEAAGPKKVESNKEGTKNEESKKDTTKIIPLDPTKENKGNVGEA